MATNKLNNAQLPKNEEFHRIGDSGEPAFLNSWENYSTTYPPCGFMKDQYGRVHLKGLVRNGTANTDIFTLPVGYRPAKAMHIVVAGSQGDPVSTLHVFDNGDVQQRTGVNTWVSLDGVSFRADQ